MVGIELSCFVLFEFCMHAFALPIVGMTLQAMHIFALLVIYMTLQAPVVGMTLQARSTS